MSSNGRLYIASPHTSPLILHWSVFYWWVPLIPISCSFQSFILLYFTTQNWQYWHYILPQRKIIKWITLFLFVRATDQNITLRITCFVRWLLACKEYSATIWENSICKNWIYFSHQAFNRDKTTSTWNISGKDFYPEFLLLLINSFPICGRKITFLCKLINTGLE